VLHYAILGIFLGRRLLSHISNKGARRTRGQVLKLARVEKYPSYRKAAQREYALKHDSFLKQKTTRLTLIQEFQEQNEEKLTQVNQLLEQLFTVVNNINQRAKKIGKEL
jgi:predicted GIY-YIG superfamily endonuclease